MFGKSFRRIRAIGAAIAMASLVIVPVRADAAAPSISSVEVFGNVRPGTTPINPDMGQSTLFANSRPIPSLIGEGILLIRGRATGDVDLDGKLRLFIDIKVTDGLGAEVTKTVTVKQVTDGSITQGDFNAELEVTELGTHEAADNSDKKSLDPADWGGHSLTVELTPRNHPNNGGTLGTKVSRSIIKYPATPGDETAPQLTSVTWPPQHWCHFSSVGMRSPHNSGTHLNGTREGNCGTATGTPVGNVAVPDATWVACVNWTPGFDHQSLNPFRGSMCRTSPDGSIPIGHSLISARINDMHAAAQGIASEIKSAVIQVFSGDPDLAGNTPLMTKPNLAPRVGPKSGYGIAWNINWLAPNAYTGDPPYFFKVTVCDAWDNCTVAKSPGITIYPY